MNSTIFLLGVIAGVILAVNVLPVTVNKNTINTDKVKVKNSDGVNIDSKSSLELQAEKTEKRGFFKRIFGRKERRGIAESNN